MILIKLHPSPQSNIHKIQELFRAAPVLLYCDALQNSLMELNVLFVVDSFREQRNNQTNFFQGKVIVVSADTEFFGGILVYMEE